MRDWYLDCSGADSIFVRRGDNFKHEYYWSVYGKLYEGTNADPSITNLAIHVGDYGTKKILINDIPEGKW